MTPLPFVTELAAMCRPGTRVLDLGAGRGRNALFLARQGFHVDAVDTWAAAVEEMNASAAANALPLQAAVHDLQKATPDCSVYGAVVCTLVLHLLTPERAGSVLAEARASAAPGALHAIAAITSEGDFAGDVGPGARYYPVPGAVARAYADAGWDVHLAFEETRSMREAHPDGTRKQNVVSFVLAEKRPAASSDR